MYRDFGFKVYDIDLIYNDFLKEHSLPFEDLKIIFCYEDSIIIKKDDELIKLGKVAGPFEKLEIDSFINES